MFNWIRKYFAKKENEQEKLFSMNRERFIEIYTDKRFNYLEEVIGKLENKDIALKDEEIITAYQKFSDSMQSNTFAIGELEFAIISQICCYKPHLTEHLLERGILSVIYSYGDEINADAVIWFIDNQMLKEGVEPYGGLPNEDGVDWLKNLKNQKPIVQKVLEKTIAENK